jgi:hypothetical protein
MQTIKLMLQAGVPVPVHVAGTVLLLQEADQGNALTLQFSIGGAISATVDNMGAGARIAPQGGFTSVTVSSAVAGQVVFIITRGDIEIQLSQVNTLVTNTDALAVPVRTPDGTRLAVDIGGGTVSVTADNVGINNTPANPVPVSIISEPGAPFAVNGTVNIGNAAGAPVPVAGNVTVTPSQAATVTDAAALAVAAYNGASPNQVHIRTAGACRALRIGNPLTSTGKLYIGGAGITPSNAVIVLQPGDLWNETDAPQLDWYATSDTGATATMQVIA